MAVCPVVHQVDGRQEVGLEQVAFAVVEKFPLLSVDIALDLSSVILELMESDPGVDILVKILHVVNLEAKT